MDNGISAWQRNRKRDGWDELIAAAKRGEISHIVCYHPDRLMRQPHDLEELLTISDQHGITLYGRVNRRDLRDPDDRYALRIEVAHACRSSDDTSRRVRDEIADRAEKGMPHTTKRRYGYSRNGMVVNDAEAEVIREIFGRFTAGEGPRTIAAVLDGRGITTAQGKRWTAVAVRDQLRSKYVAGIRVHRGKETGRGVWRAIIERGVWDLAREMLDFRAARANVSRVCRGPMAGISARMPSAGSRNAAAGRSLPARWNSLWRMLLWICLPGWPWMGGRVGRRKPKRQRPRLPMMSGSSKSWMGCGRLRRSRPRPTGRCAGKSLRASPAMSRRPSPARSKPGKG